jgi:hypothetical protein
VLEKFKAEGINKESCAKEKLDTVAGFAKH